MAIDDLFECYTLELPRVYQGAENVPQHCCIPAGIYPIGFYASPHNRRIVPIVKEVPDRSMIEIHIANKPADLLGCIGVGQTRGPDPDWIGGSGKAFDALMAKLQIAKKAGMQLEIEIVNS